MNWSFVLFIALLVIPVALLLAAWRAWWGDGNHELRRCPNCQYDMTHTPGKKCPECGNAAQSTYALFQRRNHPRLARLCLLGFIVTTPVGVWNALPAPWTQKTPRALQTYIVDWAAKPPPSPAGLPGVNPAFELSPKPWERLQWQYQVTRALGACHAHVTSIDGDITNDQMQSLVPMLDEVNALAAKFSHVPREDAWMIIASLDRFDRQHSDEFARDLQSTATMRHGWFLGSLVSFIFGYGFDDPSDAIYINNAIIAQALRHPAPAVRAYGLRCCNERLEAEFIGSNTGPPYELEHITYMSKTDPDPTIRDLATATADRYSQW